MRSRDDYVTGSSDSFAYDQLDRLTHATYQQSPPAGTQAQAALNQAFSWHYDALGNIRSREEGGVTRAYTYAEESTGPRLVAVSGQGSIAYDANGAMTTIGDRTLTWSGFGKPTQVASSNGMVSFDYAPDRARYRKVDQPLGGDTSETLYVGGGYERTRATSLLGGARVVHTHSIVAGGRRIAARILSSTDGDEIADQARTSYFHTDALGSVEVVTNHVGEVVKRYKYDPFGKRHDITQIDIDQNRDGTISLVDAQQALARGYTGHEEIETAGLIHMNGRVYDASLQRFLSADPNIQAPSNTQNHNRYSYVLNNPLKYTDPSGYFFKKVWKKIKRAVRKYWRQIAAIAITVATAGISATWAFVGGFTSGLVLSGGDIRAALIGGLTAYAMYQIGRWVTKGGTETVAARSPAHVKKVIAHGLVGGGGSAAQGGKFRDGFLGSAFSAFATPWISANVQTQSGQILVSALVGGTSAKIGGGKFANGAVFAAMSYAYNNCLSGGCRFFSKYEGQAMQQQARDAVQDAQKEAVIKFVDAAKGDGLGHVSDASGAVAIGCGAAGMAPCAAAAGAVSIVSGSGQVAVDLLSENNDSATLEAAKLANSMTADAAASSAVRNAPGPVGRVIGVAVQTMSYVSNQLVDQPRDNYVEK